MHSCEAPVCCPFLLLLPTKRWAPRALKHVHKGTSEPGHTLASRPLYKHKAQEASIAFVKTKRFGQGRPVSLEQTGTDVTCLMEVREKISPLGCPTQGLHPCSLQKHRELGKTKNLLIVLLHYPNSDSGNLGGPACVAVGHYCLQPC